MAFITPLHPLPANYQECAGGEPLPSPGLEPPHHRLVVLPERQICDCGRRLFTVEERLGGLCQECTSYNRLAPLIPCACEYIRERNV